MKPNIFSEKLNFGLGRDIKNNEKEIPASLNSQGRGSPWQKYGELRIKVL